MKVYVDFDPIITELKSGNIILYPTDTILGLGCDSYSKEAVDKLFNLKKRDKNKAFIILVSSLNMLLEHVKINYSVVNFIEKYPRPISVIYNNVKNIAKNILSEDGSVAIRLVKKNIFCKDLINKFGRPIVSTSANISGESSPSNLEEIDINILKNVYLPNNISLTNEDYFPSDIAKIEDGKLSFIRKYDVFK